jgi:hypothetical protein
VSAWAALQWASTATTAPASSDLEGVMI